MFFEYTLFRLRMRFKYLNNLLELKYVFSVLNVAVFVIGVRFNDYLWRFTTLTALVPFASHRCHTAQLPNKKRYVESTSIRRPYVEARSMSMTKLSQIFKKKIPSSLYMLTIALKSVFRRTLSFFTAPGKPEGLMLFRRRNDVETMSKRQVRWNLVALFTRISSISTEISIFCPPLRCRTDVDSTNYLSLGWRRPFEEALISLIQRDQKFLQYSISWLKLILKPDRFV